MSRDPIGYEGGPNLYEYVGSSPVGSVDPLGLLEWSHRVLSGPDRLGPDRKYHLDLNFGFRLRIRQSLSDQGRRTLPVIGTQSWQTNDMRTVVLVRDGDRCRWEQSRNRILDVKNLGEPTPIHITDTLGLREDDVNTDENVEVVFAAQDVDKKLGLRPYAVGDSGVRFTEEPLRAGTYEATDEEWSQAQNMTGPLLEATQNYVFLDRDRAAVCSKDQLELAAMLLRRRTTLWSQMNRQPQEGLDPTVRKLEYLSYGELGSWLELGR